METLNILLPVFTLVIGLFFNSMKDYIDRKEKNNELRRKEKIEIFLNVSKIRKMIKDKFSNITEDEDHGKIDTYLSLLDNNLNNLSEILFHLNIYYKQKDKSIKKIDQTLSEAYKLYNIAKSNSYMEYVTVNELLLNFIECFHKIIDVLNQMSNVISDDLN